MEHHELLDIYQTSMGLAQLPWSSVSFDIDSLVKIYALPGDYELNNLDKYLYPGYLD